MIKNSKFSLLLLFFFFNTVTCEAKVANPFYAGILGGGGSTTWDGLVPSEQNQNFALMLSTPTDVQEGGGVWGAFAGYEFTRFFAIEAHYMHYPSAIVFFDEFSIFSFTHEGDSMLATHTETVNLLAKIMLEIPQTQFRVFSSAGVAAVHRDDIVVNNWRGSPSFDVGFSYDVDKHLMAELVANYTAGYGESLLNPADTYFPFLYSVTARIAYRF